MAMAKVLLTKDQNMITPEKIEEFKAAQAKLATISDEINIRVQEIIILIHKAFDKKFTPGWWYPNDSEYCSDLDTDYDEEEIAFELSNYKNFQTHIWDYSTGFPKKFLFMTDQDIIWQIEKDIKETEQKAKEKKEKAAARKKKKADLAKKAKAKLSSEERKALGI